MSGGSIMQVDRMPTALPLQQAGWALHTATTTQTPDEQAIRGVTIPKDLLKVESKDTAKEAKASAAEVSQATEKVNRQFEEAGSYLRFRVDKDTGQSIVTMYDTTSNEVIRQFPNEQVLSMSKRIETLLGKGGQGQLPKGMMVEGRA
jgi:flagellar protein FlaG